MAALTAAVVFVGLLGLVNLLFLFGVVRRLREHTGVLDDLRRGAPAREPVPPMLVAGDAVGDFVTDTLDGERVSWDGLDGVTLVGVFASDCSACEWSIETFAEYAAAHPGGRERTLAVVVGPEEDCASYAERLAAAARVVVEQRGGPLTTALAVRGYPAFALIDDGLVTASGYEPGVLPAAVG